MHRHSSDMGIAQVLILLISQLAVGTGTLWVQLRLPSATKDDMRPYLPYEPPSLPRGGQKYRDLRVQLTKSHIDVEVL